MKITRYLLLCLWAILFFSCSKESKESIADESTPLYYFSATVNGKQVKYEAEEVNSRFECNSFSPIYSLIK